MQKRLFYLGVFALLNFLSFSQNSEFLGYFSPTISHLVPATANQVSPHEVLVKPNFKGRELVEVDQSNTHNPDWVWQQHATTEKNASASVLWAFQGLGTNLSPPDPTLDADSNVVIESTNSSGGAVYRIFNKNTGATIVSSLTMQSLGGSAGLGDPIVLYYKPAKRWFLTEFSSSGNKLLIHVSQTSNPQGAYYTYSFTCTSFPDYPKYGFCEASDAFIASTNQGGPPTVYAMKISALIAGATSPFIKTTIGYSLNGFGFQSITPVDLEGDNPAPAGMKPLFIRHRDDESHTNGTPDSGTNDWIELWEMTINWTANTATVAKIQDVAIAEIDSKLCGLTSFACIKQPGTTNTLDPLRETVMYKAPMRVFDDHQTILAALSTDVDGADRSGVRWVELRRAANVTTATWSNYQEGTYAPGTGTSRWMPAINIDKYGNIIMAYSTSSNNAGDFPSIKMTGRRPCDPLGQMTMPETTIIAGTSSKTGDTRWGDYHHMSIDDFDGKTFYFAGVYHNAQTKSNVSAIRMNPDLLDASIAQIFVPGAGTGCGSSSQIGVVVEQTGSTSITSGVLTWQVGTGSVNTVNYTSNQLTAIGSLDTIFVTVNGLVSGSNTINISTTTVNGTSPDDNTCNDTKSISINVTGGSSISANSNINFLPTCTANNGQVTLTVTGGSAPYSYSINNGTPQASPIFSNLAPGSYTYSITENGGCSVFGTFNLPAAAVVNVTPTQTAVINCNGNTNGAITIAATGGQATY
ncbi:MAG: SprB repeat-containing protein, partial [Crocinitomicaceae bacterium]